MFFIPSKEHIVSDIKDYLKCHLVRNQEIHMLQDKQLNGKDIAKILYVCQSMLFSLAIAYRRL